MSESEEEAAFASADEDVTESKMSEPKEGKAKTQKGKKGGNATDTKEGGDTAESSRETAKKGKGKQQKQKGKGAQTQKGPSPGTTSASKVSAESSKTNKAKPSKGNSAASEDTSMPDSGGIDKSPPKAQEEHKDTSGKPQESVSAAEGKDTPMKEETSQERGIDVSAASKSDSPSKESETKSEVLSPSGQNISREAGDNETPRKEGTPSVEEAVDTQQKQSQGGGWGWGGWGSSLLSAASNSVQTFTSQVGDGFTTIIDTVESSLAGPDQEELLRKAKAAKEPKPEHDDVKEDTDKSKKHEIPVKKDADADSAKMEAESDTASGQTEGESGGNGWFSSWGVTDLAKKVQNTGKTIASKGHTLMSEGFDAVESLAAGGIDVLETIGKKTYDTLSEHDPAFKKTRDYIRSKGNKPNLSSMLRDAKEQAEQEAAQERENEEFRKAHFETLFDEYQGIAHLEALEILSNQSEKKVHTLLNSLSSEDLKVIKPILVAIKEAFEVEEEDTQADSSKDQDFSNLVSQYLSELELGTAPDKLNQVHDMVKQWILEFDSHDGETVKNVHQRAIQSMAELTSKGVEQFHKAGELVLMQKEADKDCKERAHSFARLTGVLCHEVGNLATKFSECLNKLAQDQQESEDDVTALVTNVYLEATNSSTYIQDAFQLLLPVLQHAAIEHRILTQHS